MNRAFSFCVFVLLFSQSNFAYSTEEILKKIRDEFGYPEAKNFVSPQNENRKANKTVKPLNEIALEKIHDWVESGASEPFLEERKSQENIRIDLKKQFGSQNPRQGRAGTCSLFSAKGLMEATYFRSRHETKDFSVQWLVREIAGPALAMETESPKEFKIYLGGSLIEVLDTAQHYGLCSTAEFQYSALDAVRLDRSQLPLASFASILKIFAKAYYLSEDQRLNNCKHEAESLRTDALEWSSFVLSPVDVRNALLVLSLGIPITIGIQLPNQPSTHALTLVGFDLQKRVYLVRDSAGFFNSSISFEKLHKYYDENQSLYSLAEVLIHRDERTRLCRVADFREIFPEVCKNT
jgi:hypothetical protein